MATPVLRVLDDAHIFLCKGASYNQEHHLLRDAILQSVEEVGKTADYGALQARREAPLLTLPCVEPLSDQERIAVLNNKPAHDWPRLTNMDIYIRHIGAEDNAFQHNLYDVTITSPPGDWTSTNASDAVTSSRPLDYFIDEKERRKFFHFKASFKAANGHDTSFFPLAFDRSGRAGAATTQRLKYIKNLLSDLSGATSSRHSVGQALTDRISVALQTGIARHIAATRQLHRRQLQLAAIAAGAGQQAPLQAGGIGAAGHQA
jgi:hypothetical protein